MKSALQLFYSLFFLLSLFHGVSLAQSTNTKAASFNGTDSYIAIPNASVLNPATQITVEAWIYPKVNTGCNCIVGKNWPSTFWFGLNCGGGALRFYADGGHPKDGVASVQINKWTHVAATYDGSVTKLYINGILDATSSTSSYPLKSSTDSLCIGADRKGSYLFNGLISNVRIWDVARTADDIKNNMNLKLTGTIAGLVASYPLDGDSKDRCGTNDGILRNVTFTTLVSVEKNEIPTEFALGQNFPNPFNPNTVINYQLPTPGYVTLKVYDVLGNEVVTLVNEFKQAGVYNSQFSIANFQLSSGIYFYKMTAGKYSETRKMILMK